MDSSHCWSLSGGPRQARIVGVKDTCGQFLDKEAWASGSPKVCTRVLRWSWGEPVDREMAGTHRQLLAAARG